MRPLDPRLNKYATATRPFLVASLLVSLLLAGLIVAQAAALVQVINGVFLGEETLASLAPTVFWLAGIVVVRAVLTYLLETYSFRSAAKAKSQLRMAAAEAVTTGNAVPPTAGSWAQSMTRGIDSIDDYFAKYLPQLVLAVLIPLTIIGVVVTQDLLAAVIIAVTVPIIPVFMILIGLYTQRETDKQWASLEKLANYFLDIVAGLPSLIVLRRAKAQAANIKEVSNQYRRTTMRALRISFLSSMVLELFASLSVAVVAVSIGVRLVNGTMEFSTGLLVLILAPEAYLPLRQLGAHYHAAAEGLSAADKLLTTIESSKRKGEQPLPVGAWGYELTDLEIGYDGSLVGKVSGEIPAGRITVLSGDSGVGKTTFLSTLMGFTPPVGGDIQILATEAGPRVALADVDPTQLHASIGWIPQSPLTVVGTVSENLCLGTAASAAQQSAALAAVGLPSDSAFLKQRINDNGVGISVGQLRRLALARALLRDCPVIFLDEPSASLDAESEQKVVSAIRELNGQGRTIVLVAHRAALQGLADHEISLVSTEVLS